MRGSRGFTLIELMIVIAILGILLAIAIPAYQDYTIRTKVGEGLNVAATAKTGVVSAVHSTGGTLPDSNSEAGLDAPTEYAGDNVLQVAVGSDGGQSPGIIEITYQNTPEIDGETLLLSPITYAGSINWSCGGGSTSVSRKYLPSQCR